MKRKYLLRDISVNEFYQNVVKLRNIKDTKEFFDCLCNQSELFELIKRFIICKKIRAGEKIQNIITRLPKENYRIAQIISRVNNIKIKNYG